MSTKSRFSMAVEELEEEQAAVAAAEPEVAVDAETVEAVDDTVDTSEAGDTDLAEIDSAADDADALDAIAGKVDEAAEGEGLTPEAADAISIAVERIYSRLGMKSMKMPAAESFGSARDRKSATKMAAESFKEGAQKVWAAIVKFFEQAVTWIKNFFAKLFSANLRLKASAEAIATKAKDLSGSPKEAEIEAKGFATTLEVGGKVDPKSVVAGLKRVQTFNDTILDNVSDFAIKVADAVMTNPEKLMEKSVSSQMLVGLNRAGTDGDKQVFKSDVLPGNKALSLTVPNGWKQSAEIALNPFSESRVHFTAFDDKSKGFEGDKVKTAQPREILEIANQVVSMTTDLDKHKNLGAQLSKDMASIISHIKSIVKDTEDKDAKEIVRAQQRLIQKVGSVVQSVPSAVTSNAVRTGKAALDYATKSMAQYGAKVAPAAKAAK